MNKIKEKLKIGEYQPYNNGKAWLIKTHEKDEDYYYTTNQDTAEILKTILDIKKEIIKLKKQIKKVIK